MTEIQDYGMGDFNTLYHYTSADGKKYFVALNSRFNSRKRFQSAFQDVV